MTTNQTAKTKPEKGNIDPKTTKNPSKSAKTPSKSTKKLQKAPSKHQNFLHQLFGGLNLTWPKLIILLAFIGVRFKIQRS